MDRREHAGAAQGDFRFNSFIALALADRLGGAYGLLLILATAAGLAANLAGLRAPALLEPVLTHIGSASLALGLMAAGAGMQLGSLAIATQLGMASLPFALSALR